MSFQLNRNTAILFDESILPLHYAVKILKRDMDACLSVAGEKNEISLFHDLTLPEESYRIEVTTERISVYYADPLGGVYGLLSISAKYLGIRPFDFWNEITPEKYDVIEIAPTIYVSPDYAVRFRCWFVNDEVLLDGWKTEPDDMTAMWERVFETLLRAGGNMVIPGTDRKGEVLAYLASDMGLWLTQHHAELLGARMFARAYPELTPSYFQHPEEFESLWQEAVEHMEGRNVLWTIGYRGQGDMAFWHADHAFDTDEKRGAEISRILTRQMEIVRLVNPKARFSTNLYGEMMGLYQNGHLKLPEDVIKIWADNGYGKMVSRRQENNDPRVPSMPPADGRENGLYYHAAFYDLQAANHITMNPVSPRLIAGELQTAIKNNATACWVLNVGSIKPHIYVLDMIAEIWKTGALDADAHAEHYAQSYFRQKSVAPFFLGFWENTVKFGAHEDNRAGDQFYHFPLRMIVRRLMRGEMEGSIAPLHWLTGDVSFFAQIEKIRDIVVPAIQKWEKYLSKAYAMQALLDEKGAALFSDTIILQGALHLNGAKGLASLCNACLVLQAGDPVKAYCEAHRALQAHRTGRAMMDAAERGVFTGIYQNDCFTNVALTISTLTALRSWIRVAFDGDLQYDWEKAYLTSPKDVAVRLLTHRTNQLDDETLCERLIEVFG